ncbi:unnamed protein product [marine sediment metagenome]|uniref:Uncharacterized protein n=1 Tax=marine sediment metagenome TaxID=412755 RepID=X1NFZ3_9ZZZZ
MTLEEAITTLERMVSHRVFWGKYGHEDAVELGIQALQRVKDVRAGNGYFPLVPLPGETIQPNLQEQSPVDELESKTKEAAA